MTNKDRISDMLKHSRYAAGLSQKEVAKRLKLSGRTVQNWEEGISVPSFEMVLNWFQKIDQPLYPYIIKIIHRQETEHLSEISSECDIKNALQALIADLPKEQCQKILYFLLGNHGSMPEGVLEMITAYLHIPLSMRINICQEIYTDYIVSKAHGMIVNEDDVKPDEEMIHRLIAASIEAVLQNQSSYTEWGK